MVNGQGLRVKEHGLRVKCKRVMVSVQRIGDRGCVIMIQSQWLMCNGHGLMFKRSELGFWVKAWSTMIAC